jgi:hypothetical protein
MHPHFVLAKLAVEPVLVTKWGVAFWRAHVELLHRAGQVFNSLRYVEVF